MKRSIAALLALTLSASLLTGCQKAKSDNAKDILDEKTSAPAETVSPKDAEKNETAKERKKNTPTEEEEYTGPMGRYVDEAVTLPEEITNGTIDLLYPASNSDNSLADAYGMTYDFSKFYRFQMDENLSWTTEELKWAEDAMPKDGKSWPEYITIGKDGKGYLLYYGDSGATGHIIRQVSDTKWEDLKLPYFQSTDSRGRKPHPQLLSVDSNGDLYLGDYYSYTVIDGKTLKEKNCYAPTDELVSIYLDDESVFIVSAKDSTVYQYNKMDFTEVNTFKFKTSVPYSATVCTNKDKKLYLMIQEGLYTIQSDHSSWEMVMDGSLGILCDSSISPQCIYCGRSDDYFFWAEKRLYHISFNEQVPTQPAKTLTVFSLYNSDEIHKAAALYQIKHPEYRVELKIATEAKCERDRNEANVNDYITALNTELLAGKGCDILILDGLPYEDYRDKGIFANLYDYVPSLNTPSDFQENIIKSCETDGVLYYIPTFLTYYGIQGSDELIKPAESLHSILEYMKSCGNDEYFSQWSLEQFSEFVFNLEADRLCSKSKFMNQQDMIQLFQDMRIIQNMTKDGLDFKDYDEQHDFEVYLDTLMKKDSKTLHADIVASNSMNMQMAYVDEKRGGTITSLTNECIPYTMASINKNSKQPEAAGEYIDLLLS